MIIFFKAELVRYTLNNKVGLIFYKNVVNFDDPLCIYPKRVLYNKYKAIRKVMAKMCEIILFLINPNIH